MSVGVNTADNVCPPTDNAEVFNVACPPETTTGDPIEDDPSLNCTEPATAGDTVAVNVTVAPAAADPDGETPNDVDVDVFTIE